MKPFNAMAFKYYKQGAVGAPIPVTFRGGTKAPLVGRQSTGKQWIGGADNWPDLDTLQEWSYIHGGYASIGLRLFKNVVGIDVDMYDGKAGRRSLAMLQRKYGELPLTWMSTARDDGSGIRLFRLPPDVDTQTWRDPDIHMYPGVELIRWGARFATCYPSIHHKTHTRYRWMNPDWYSEDDVWPRVDDLAELPESWYPAFATGHRYGNMSVRFVGDPGEWLRARPNGDGEPCREMARLLALACREVRTAGVDGGAYDAAREGIWRMVGNAAEGCQGAYTALRKLWAVYAEVMAENRRRTARQVDDEFTRAIKDAIPKKERLSDSDPCALVGRMGRRAR